jgi:PhnB protein
MSKVKAVPDGYHTLTPFFNLKDCAKALDWYKKNLGAEERSRMPGPDGKIMHAELKIGDSLVMFSEAMMMPPTTGGGCHVYVNDPDALFNKAVAGGAKVESPIQNMFWGDRFGRVTDPFGVGWSIASHIEDIAPEEMKKRAEAAFAQMAQQQKK